MAKFSISKAAQAVTGQGMSAFSLPLRKPKKPEVDEDWEKAKKVLNYIAENKARRGAVTPAQATFKKRRMSGLGSALSTAAYAAQANAGTPVPGQEWAQGILKGLSGIGVSAAAAARMNAESEGKKAAFTNLMALLEQKKRNRMTADEEGERARKIAEGRLPSELQKLEKASIAKREFEKSKAERGTGMTDAQLAAVNDKAWDNAQAKFKANYQIPADEELLIEFIKQKDRLLSGKRVPVVPKLPD